MVNAQEWLNRKYPTPEAKAAVKRIGPNQDPAKKIGDDLLSAVTKGRNLSSVFSSFLDNVVNKNNQLGDNLNLEGSLSFKGFINLEELDISNQKITALDISDCSQLRDLDCSNNQIADLDLSNNRQIEYINFSNNKLANLDIAGLTKIEKIFCSDNELTSLEFLKNLNPTEIRTLRMGNNQFTAQDLSCFAHLTGLNRLFIENMPFYGSLKPLRNLTELKGIGISGTNIDSGIEYLPEDFFKVNPTASSLGLRGGYFTRTLYCSGKLAEQLKDYEVKDNPLMNYDWPRWRRDNVGLVAEANAPFEPKNDIDQGKKIQELQEAEPLKKQTQLKPTLNHLLGKGGYGEVYHGKWNLQDVAVKKLYLSLPNISKSDLKDIRREINILKNLRNRYIIQYYDTYSDNQEILIIMEYAENGTLTKFINDNKEKNHSWELNSNIIKQIALGLVYIHQQGIIHRDLKSLNVLLTDGYKVKISDFGLSRTKIISSSQSKNNVVGTLRWMAPEVIREQKYSEQSDIYALGMIIWEIAAKCTIPFKDIDNNSVMFKIVFGNGKETIPDDTPENIHYIIKRCWDNNPHERINLVNLLGMIENNLSQNDHQYWVSKDMDISLDKLNLQEDQQPEQTAQIQQNYPFKK